MPHQKFACPPCFYYSVNEIKYPITTAAGGTMFIWSVVKGDNFFKGVEWVCTHARHTAWRSLTCDFVLKKKQLNELRERRFIQNLPKPRTCYGNKPLCEAQIAVEV